jgi:DNA-directed RNA polymerase subunit L
MPLTQLMAETTTHELVDELLRRCSCLAIAYRIPQEQNVHYRWMCDPVGKTHESLGMTHTLMNVIEDSLLDEENYEDAPC